MEGFVNDHLSDEVNEKLEKGLPIDEAIVLIKNDLYKTGTLDDEINWMLVNKRDGHTSFSKAIKWVDGDTKELTNEIVKGRWLVMGPFNEFFTWKTSPITEIIEAREDFYHFKTCNSEYKLFKGDMKTFKSDEYNESIGEWIRGI